MSDLEGGADFKPNIETDRDLADKLALPSVPQFRLSEVVRLSDILDRLLGPQTSESPRTSTLNPGKSSAPSPLAKTEPVPASTLTSDSSRSPLAFSEPPQQPKPAEIDPCQLSIAPTQRPPTRSLFKLTVSPPSFLSGSDKKNLVSQLITGRYFFEGYTYSSRKIEAVRSALYENQYLLPTAFRLMETGGVPRVLGELTDEENDAYIVGDSVKELPAERCDTVYDEIAYKHVGDDEKKLCRGTVVDMLREYPALHPMNYDVYLQLSRLFGPIDCISGTLLETPENVREKGCAVLARHVNNKSFPNLNTKEGLAAVADPLKYAAYKLFVNSSPGDVENDFQINITKEYGRCYMRRRIGPRYFFLLPKARR